MAPQVTTDPYASIATPIQASAAPAASAPAAADTSDPYASIATPISSPPTFTSPVAQFAGKIGDAARDTAGDIAGAVKNMIPTSPLDTRMAQSVWNNLPPVELADAVKQTLPLIHAYETSRSGGASIGDALKVVDSTARQHASNVANVKPIVEAFRNNPTRETARALMDAAALAASMFIPGADEEAVTEASTAAAPEATAAAAPEAEAVGSPSWLQKMNPFKRLLTSPKEAGIAATQEPGAEAIRTATGAPAGTPILAGKQTAADDAIAKLGVQKDAAYKQIDDTVGFDLKAENQKLRDTQYAIKQPGADTKGLQAEIDASTQQIAEANAKLAKAGIDPKTADQLNTSWEAGKQFKNDIVRSTSPDGKIKIDSLLNRGKLSRFNPRGDRLAQFLGKGDVAAGKVAADQYMQDLAVAQKAGVRAVNAQRVHQWVAGLIGTTLAGAAGYEGGKLLLAPEP